MVIIQTFGFFIFAAGVVLLFATWQADTEEQEPAEDERWVPGAPGVPRIPPKKTR